MTRAHRLLPLLVIIALTAGGKCRPTKSPVPPPPGPGGASPGIRECPPAHDSSVEGALTLLTSGTAGIPEYNDCQRFVVKGKYDSLYAIYATHPQTFDTAPAVGTLVAIINSFGGTYPALDIEPGFNCVYLSGSRLLAGVIQGAATPPLCPGIIRMVRLRKALQSRPTVAQGFNADSDYPEVARWDWDSKHSTQYLGVKCGSAWCEIGQSGFESSPDWTPMPGLPPRMRRNVMIKGWYDEQTLAGPAAVPGGLATVSDIHATIFPSASLADYDNNAAFTAQWRVIAYVAMSRTSEKYLSTMNFAATPGANPATALDPGTLNQIELCAGTAAQCHVPDPVPTCPATTGSGATIFGFSRIKQPGGSTLYKCVAQYGNTTAPFPPAATRWRWVADDETSWTRCGQGCCEVH